MTNNKPTDETMKKNRIVSGATLIAVAVIAPHLAFAQCGASKTTASDACTTSKDIVAVAAGAENFKTLVAAIKAAGLTEVLQGKGPFTVFAPTDEAFAKLPEGTVENLLKPENREKLVSILKYHVIPGKVTAADVRTMQVKTAQGQKVQLKVSDSGVTVADARVIKTDVMAENGVIHVIDKVILPQT